MSILAEFDPSVNAREQRAIQPSVRKYGSLITEDGFTQFPNLVKEFLHHLGLCSTAILLVIELIGCRRQPEQEIFPSVRTLARELRVCTRRVNQLTAQLVALGLLIRTERFAERSQIANIYDLEPLFRRVEAWHSAEIATDLAEQEAAADEPFTPQSVIEEAAQCISEEYGEPEPRQQRYNAQRLARTWEQHSHLGWASFADIVEKAATQTEKRRDEPTRTGKAFSKLVPYFFSALDYWLSKSPAPQPTTHTQQSQKQYTTMASAHKGSQQPAKKSGVLAERARERKAAEAAGRAKVHAPEELTRRIEATALTYREKNVKSAIQRAANLMHDAQIDEAQMCEIIDQARAATSRATGVKNRMSYFFAVLEEMLSKCCPNVTNTSKGIDNTI